MQWVETTGRSVEEAKDAALDQLGVDEQDAEFEVLEESKMGLFGRVRSEARVRARVRPTRPRPKDDRRDRRRRRGGEQRTGGGSSPASQAQETAEPAGTAGAETGPAGPTTDGGPQMDQDVSLREQGDVALGFVAGLLDAFGVDGSAELREVDEETVEVAVSGDELGLLIGPKGTTLNAIQEVTRTVVQRQTGGRNGRILVDVAGYREKRKLALSRFTRDVAEQVRASGQRKVLEPMSPADRKVVHDTVNEIEGVRTSSEGEEPRRRVVIEPDA
jgi:spoIIIJ-associated protein